MSACDGSSSRLSDLRTTDTVHVDSASVSDAEPVQNSNSAVTNVRSSHVQEETLSDDELLKGLLTDTFCQVCEAVLLFESQRVSHYQGKKHAQRVQMFLRSRRAERTKWNQKHADIQSCSAGPEKFCELCNMVFSSPVVARSHYVGKVHAKNLRKSSNAISLDSKAHPVMTREATTRCTVNPEQKESSDPAAREVDLNDPNKYCKLCAASFNNPLMAQQHYGGRKHQRRHTQLETLSSLGETSEHGNNVTPLTCPLCSATFSSVDVYQAHMQGKKHHIKERKIGDLCKKKAFDSFQDELADYIQVQKARGLEPKTKPGSEIQEDEGPGFDEKLQLLRNQWDLQHHHHLHQHWSPPFVPRPAHAAVRGGFPPHIQGTHQGYAPYPPPLIPGLTGWALRNWKLPDADGSSSSSLSGSSSSSDSSGEGGESPRRKRSQRRRQGHGPEEDPGRRRSKHRRKRDDAKRARRRRDSSSEKEREKTPRETKHGAQASRGRQRRGHGPPRPNENLLSLQEALSSGIDGEQTCRAEHIEQKCKLKKEKKKPGREDSRTEEEKLWDETILGVF